LIPEAALPAIKARLDMTQLAQDVICEHGYVAIGLDHFAKPDDAMAKAARAGTLSRNFQGYTTDQGASLLGLGASSIGSLSQGYVQNLPTVPLYRPMIEKGRLPIARGIKLSEDDRIRRKVIEELMCRLEVDLEGLAHDAGMAPSLFAASLDRLAPFVAQGVVERFGMTIKVPRKWAAALRLAASAFDEYLPRDKAVHSLSV
jgi:oxygen-independent coproporphyrinogen-3 oxidase